MKINLAKSSGFCLGVKRAINIALTTAERHDQIHMLGDIVHNEDVVRQLNKAGIKKISRIAGVKNTVFLVRAHGIPLSIIEKAKTAGYKIVDATCPMVKQIHRIARKMEQQGYTIIIIGDKQHDEVKGIAGQLKNKALIIKNPKDIPSGLSKKVKKAAVVVQSTQNIDQVLKVIKLLKKKIKRLQSNNTICKPTRAKQKELRQLSLKNDVMIIIGSKTSANTKRLYQIANSLNPNSFWVQSEAELKPVWFRNVKTVGVAAGASTPDSTTQGVLDKIRHYARTGNHHW